MFSIASSLISVLLGIYLKISTKQEDKSQKSLWKILVGFGSINLIIDIFRYFGR